MDEQIELDGFKPPEEYDTGMNYNSIIYDFVKKKGCSYPAEIMREVGISKDTLYAHLFELTKKEWLVKHNLAGMFTVPAWLKPRVKEMWSMNIKGDRIKGMAWYTVFDAVEMSNKSEQKRDEEHRKSITKIDGEMNIDRGVEPTDEQKVAMAEDGD